MKCDILHSQRTHTDCAHTESKHHWHRQCNKYMQLPSRCRKNSCLFGGEVEQNFAVHGKIPRNCFQHSQMYSQTTTMCTFCIFFCRCVSHLPLWQTSPAQSTRNNFNVISNLLQINWATIWANHPNAMNAAHSQRQFFNFSCNQKCISRLQPNNEEKSIRKCKRRPTTTTTAVIAYYFQFYFINA